jgi:hypothetical protein
MLTIFCHNVLTKKSFNPRKSVKNIYFNPTVFNWGAGSDLYQITPTSGGGKEDKEGEKEEGEDEVVMNNLMHDIKEGFIQRRLPDGGFKVS